MTWKRLACRAGRGFGLPKKAVSELNWIAANPFFFSFELFFCQEQVPKTFRLAGRFWQELLCVLQCRKGSLLPRGVSCDSTHCVCSTGFEGNSTSVRVQSWGEIIIIYRPLVRRTVFGRGRGTVQVQLCPAIMNFIAHPGEKIAHGAWCEPPGLQPLADFFLKFNLDVPPVRMTFTKPSSPLISKTFRKSWISRSCD